MNWFTVVSDSPNCSGDIIYNWWCRWRRLRGAKAKQGRCRTGSDDIADQGGDGRFPPRRVLPRRQGRVFFELDQGRLRVRGTFYEICLFPRSCGKGGASPFPLKIPQFASLETFAPYNEIRRKPRDDRAKAPASRRFREAGTGGAARRRRRESHSAHRMLARARSWHRR